MTDLEMTRICARAIGLSVELVRGTSASPGPGHGAVGRKS